MGFHPDWEKSNPKSIGATQLHFFSNIPLEDLSQVVQRKKQELKRKYPGYKLQPPQGVTGGSVGPPIEFVAQTKMSDKDWLGAMHKYDDQTEWGAPGNKFLEGGVIELSRSFGERVKDNPARFYNLAKKFDNSISMHYITQAISGLVEASAPSEWVFDLFRQFSPRIEGHFRREVCWSLNKKADDGIPDDILDITTEWALNDPDPTEERWLPPTEFETFNIQ